MPVTRCYPGRRVSSIHPVSGWWRLPRRRGRRPHVPPRTARTMIPPTFDDCRTAKYSEAVRTNDLAREPEELCCRAVAITPPPNRFAREKAAPDSYSRRSNPPTDVVPHDVDVDEVVAALSGGNPICVRRW